MTYFIEKQFILRWSVRYLTQLFNAGCSTTSWRRAIDDDMFTVVAFLDISKAFDSVNHDNYIAI